MNVDEELKQRLSGYLDTLEGSVSDAAGFIGEQAPLVAQEYLAWCFWCAILGIAIGLVMAISVPLTSWMYVRLCRKNSFWIDIAPMIITVNVFLLAFGLLIAGCNCYSAVKVSVAPRVVLLEKLAELRK